MITQEFSVLVLLVTISFLIVSKISLYKHICPRSLQNRFYLKTFID